MVIYYFSTIKHTYSFVDFFQKITENIICHMLLRHSTHYPIWKKNLTGAVRKILLIQYL